MNPSALGQPNYQMTFFHFVHEKEGNVLGALAQKHRDHHPPNRVLQSATGPCHIRVTPLVLETLPPLFIWLRPSRKSLWDFFSPFLYFMHFCTIFVPLLNSHHTHHFSFSHLTSYEVLLLTALRITLLHCSNLNPTTCLPSVTDEVPHNCLALMNHLLTPRDDLQETPLEQPFHSVLSGDEDLMHRTL